MAVHDGMTNERMHFRAEIYPFSRDLTQIPTKRGHTTVWPKICVLVHTTPMILARPYAWANAWTSTPARRQQSTQVHLHRIITSWHPRSNRTPFERLPKKWKGQYHSLIIGSAIPYKVRLSLSMSLIQSRAWKMKLFNLVNKRLIESQPRRSMEALKITKSDWRSIEF